MEDKGVQFPPSDDKEAWKRFLAEPLRQVSSEEDKERFYRLLDRYTREVVGFSGVEEPDPFRD
jgi:hypothetical protein